MNWEEKAWGQVAHLFNEHGSVSLLRVIADHCCSIHYHEHRFNQFVTIDAVIDVVIYLPEYIQTHESVPDVIPADFEMARWRLGPHESFVVPPNVVHRFEVIDGGGVTEIYWTNIGHPPSLDDIKRHSYFLGGQTT